MYGHFSRHYYSLKPDLTGMSFHFQDPRITHVNDKWSPEAVDYIEALRSAYTTSTSRSSSVDYVFTI